MHKARTSITLAKHLKVREVVRQRVDKRAAMVTHTWVHDHTRLLVDDDDVVILVDDVERYVFGHNLLLAARIWHNDRYLVERLDLIARLLGLAVYQDVATIGSGLYAVTRCVLEACGEELIEAHKRLSLVDRH